jgi:hypothetical protein
MKLNLKESVKADLPDSIKLVGFAINRTVYLDGVLLGDPQNFPNYSWGYVGEPTKTLAFMLLNQYLHSDKAKIWANTLTHHILKYINFILPSGKQPSKTEMAQLIGNGSDNFAIEFNIKGYLEALEAEKVPDQLEESLPELVWVNAFTKFLPLELEEIKNGDIAIQSTGPFKEQNPLLQ